MAKSSFPRCLVFKMANVCQCYELETKPIDTKNAPTQIRETEKKLSPASVQRSMLLSLTEALATCSTHLFNFISETHPLTLFSVEKVH